MPHPFDLANLIAGDHRPAKTPLHRLEREEGDHQVLLHPAA